MFYMIKFVRQKVGYIRFDYAYMFYIISKTWHFCIQEKKFVFPMICFMATKRHVGCGCSWHNGVRLPMLEGRNRGQPTLSYFGLSIYELKSDK